MKPLSHRERQVLRLAAEGHTNRQIADRIGVAPSTVKTQLDSVYIKLGVHSRTAAVTVAYTQGILTPTAPAVAS